MHGKFRGFSKKRSHLLTFVGALIVFSTFITKEGIVEHWKDTVSAVDTAEYRFRTASISMEILRHECGNANRSFDLLQVNRQARFRLMPPRHLKLACATSFDLIRLQKIVTIEISSQSPL